MYQIFKGNDPEPWDESEEELLGIVRSAFCLIDITERDDEFDPIKPTEWTIKRKGSDVALITFHTGVWTREERAGAPDDVVRDGHTLFEAMKVKDAGIVQ